MAKPIPGFKRLPGTARNYVDLSTNEILTRRQVDARVGSLFRSGFKDYGNRKRSVEEVKAVHYAKTGEDVARYKLRGVTDLDKAANYVKKEIGASNSALFSIKVRIKKLDTGKEVKRPRHGKYKDEGWRTMQTSFGDALSQTIADFSSFYDIDTEDIGDIEFDYLID